MQRYYKLHSHKPNFTQTMDYDWVDVLMRQVQMCYPSQTICNLLLTGIAVVPGPKGQSILSQGIITGVILQMLQIRCAVFSTHSEFILEKM